MTAIHKCPFCRKPFDYTPDDYHAKVLSLPTPLPSTSTPPTTAFKLVWTQITCGNKGCTPSFGFMLYNVSEARMKELREELKAAQVPRPLLHSCSPPFPSSPPSPSSSSSSGSNAFYAWACVHRGGLL